MERQYDKALRLFNDTTKNLAELNDLLKAQPQEELTEQEKKDLQFALLKLTIVVKEFGK